MGRSKSQATAWANYRRGKVIQLCLGKWTQNGLLGIRSPLVVQKSGCGKSTVNGRLSHPDGRAITGLRGPVVPVPARGNIFAFFCFLLFS